jgi:uncharacterized membrane protein
MKQIAVITPEGVWRRGTAVEAERWASVALATGLIAYGVSRRNLPGILVAASAAPIAYRGFAGEWPHFTRRHAVDGDGRAALATDNAIQVSDAIRVEKPVDEVYRVWRRLENLPRFMTHLAQVTDLGGGRSHWVARGPACMKIRWDAEIINEIENKLIGWRSLPGSGVVTAGSVYFSDVRGGRGAEVSVQLQYAPPAGRAGAFVASLLGREPSQMIREDLRRMKQLLEAREVPRTARSRSWRRQ